MPVFTCPCFSAVAKLTSAFFLTAGTISQWGEVSKAKKPSRTKAKDAAPAAAPAPEQNNTARAARGGRAVSEGARGRGKATDRGRGGAPRGRTAQPAATNGAARNKENQQLSVPTEESSAWGAPKATKDAPVESAPAVEQGESSKAAPLTKTWASMLRQSTAFNRPAPLADASKAKPADPAPASEPAPASDPAPETKAPEPEEETTPVATRADVVIEEPALPPPKDDLTETNLEQVIDDSQPPATGTAASTAADSWDPRQSPISTNATPLSAAQHQHQRAPVSGYAASAIKATTERPTRGPNFQRRVLDQEEAVRMPGNREVDRAAVQFGAFNLGDADEEDGDRENAETRGQPPADSPVSQPRASLPPVAQHVAVPESFSKAGAPGTPAQSNRTSLNQTNLSLGTGSAQIPTQRMFLLCSASMTIHANRFQPPKLPPSSMADLAPRTPPARSPSIPLASRPHPSRSHPSTASRPPRPNLPPREPLPPPPQTTPTTTLPTSRTATPTTTTTRSTTGSSLTASTTPSSAPLEATMRPRIV